MLDLADVGPGTDIQSVDAQDIAQQRHPIGDVVGSGNPLVRVDADQIATNDDGSVHGRADIRRTENSAGWGAIGIAVLVPSDVTRNHIVEDVSDTQDDIEIGRS